MGILTCAGISAAYLADIFIMPLMIKWIKPFGVKSLNASLRPQGTSDPWYD